MKTVAAHAALALVTAVDASILAVLPRGIPALAVPAFVLGAISVVCGGSLLALAGAWAVDRLHAHGVRLATY